MKARKERLIIMTNTLSHGGAQRVATRLANAFAERYQVFVILSAKEIAYPLSEKVKVLDLSEFRQTRSPQGPLAYKLARIRGFLAFCLFRMLLRPRASLSFLQQADEYNLRAPGGGGKKILAERNNPRMKGRAYLEDACRKFRQADTVVFQSRTVMDMFPEDIRRKGVVIPNPVEVSCKAVPGRGRIVTAGRLHAQKNHPLLIRAFKAFLQTLPGYTLHIYGEGDLSEETARLIAGMSLQDRVFLEGFRQDIHQAIRDAEMFVLSSDYEGMPNALLEAMMMGLPCITTAFPGAEEFFGSTGACLMTPVGDETALTRAMCTLAEDEGLRRELAAKGQEHAQRFSMDRIIPLWEGLL